MLPDSYGYNSMTQKLRWLNDMSLTAGGHRYAHSMCYLRFPQEAKERLFSPSLRRTLNGEFDSTVRILDYFNSTCASDAIDKMLYTDMMTRMPEHLLMLVDHMTMAHSLEDRSPLLDYHVVEFAAAIPANLKVKGSRLKHILREVAKDFLPPSLLSRSKQGFSFPLAYWMKSELGNFLETLFVKSRLAEEGYFQRDYMLELLNQHRSGQMDHNYRLWILLNLELWWRIYIDGASVEALDQLINEELELRAA
jgi:asparagine synthase (glutamine-hydrolysing)